MSDERPNGGFPEGQPPRPDRAREFQVKIPEEELNAYGAPEDNSISSFSTPPQEPQHTAQKDKKTIRREQKAHRRRNKEKGKRNKRIFKLVWLVMVIFAGLALAQYLLGGVNDMLAVDRQKLSVTVEIPKEADTDEIAQRLYDNGVIEKMDFFKLYAKFTKADGNFGHGTYKLSTDMDYEAIINHLQSNTYRVDTVRVQFREGINIREIAELLEKNGVCSAEDVLKIANTDSFDKFDVINAIPNASKRYYKLEGYLFPDTYDFYLDEDPEDALSKFIRNCDKKLTDEIYEELEAKDMTLDQMLTIASIIEAESANKEDMYVVSSILQNRLENGVETGTAQLGCDATVFYPYRTKEQVPADIRDTFESRYDTYQIIGLPPGPICNPGAAAIDAALNPDNTDYYYFCHDKDGNAYYAKTAQQHEQNLVKAGLK